MEDAQTHVIDTNWTAPYHSYNKVEEACYMVMAAYVSSRIK
jgi:hypothetical protein